MPRRKIQLIAGTTYSVSLPKDWVKKNGLKEKSELQIEEKNDRTLVILPSTEQEKKLNKISLNVDDYGTSFDQVFFAAYYLGFEHIILHSKNELTKKMRAAIREALRHMSGSEISFEDRKKIEVRVLLDKSRVEVPQVLYRLNLLLESSISGLLGKPNLNELKLNEDEIDRLYHLIAKTIQSSLLDSNILHSSKITNVSFIPPYFRIGKRLENIGDNLFSIAEHIDSTNAGFEFKKEILLFVRAKLERSVHHLLKPGDVFEKTSPEEFAEINERVEKVKDKKLQGYLEDLVRYVADTEEEVVNLSFYNELIRDKVM